jgi:LAO/AO transport system kinase
MEIPDVLVVTKADLGRVADRTLSDLRAALRSLGAAAEVLAVSSIAPPSGIAELADALARHHGSLDLTRRRVESRRLHALADFATEHGERGLRALGGRRQAERWLGGQDPEADVAGLQRALEDRACGPGPDR